MAPDRGPLDGAQVIDATADLVVVIGAGAELLYANRAAEERGGWQVADMLGQPLLSIVHPDDLDTAVLSMASVAEKVEGSLVEIRLRDSTGRYASFEVRGRPWPEGPPGAIVLNLREVTDRRRWEITRGDSEMLGAILDHLPMVAMVLSADGTLRGANRALTRLVHRPMEAMRHRPFTDLVAPDDVGRVQRALASVPGSVGPVQLEAHLARTGGDLVPVGLSVVDLLDDAAVQGMVATASDITTLVATRRELQHLASTDDLTGLPNRTSLHAHLERVLADRRAGAGHTVLFADVDGLKAINDHHGHRAGDAVLVAVGDRLRALARAGDMVARLSGDEFVVVMESVDPAAIDAFEVRIHEAMAAPITLPTGHKVTTSISVGAAPLAGAADADELLAAADAAMYVAKRERTDPSPG